MRIKVRNGAQVVRTESEIRDSTAGDFGGGAFVTGAGSLLTVINSEFTGNLASSGNAISAQDSAQIEISDSSFEGDCHQDAQSSLVDLGGTTGSCF